MPDINSLRFMKSTRTSGPKTDLLVRLQDASTSRLAIATPAEAAGWVAGDPGFYIGVPILFVAQADQETVGEVAVGMAREMGGYWLRYYNSAGKAARGEQKPVPVVSVEITAQEAVGGPGDSISVVEARIKDGRIFSILTATPGAFAKTFSRLGLRFYFGPSVLFLREMEAGLARQAVEKMATHPDRWLCRYDTPRKTLDNILADFKARYP